MHAVVLFADENGTEDNSYTYATIAITIPGDIDGDFFVNIKDAAQVGTPLLFRRIGRVGRRSLFQKA